MNPLDRMKQSVNEMIEATDIPEAHILKEVIEQAEKEITMDGRAKKAVETIAFTPELRDSLRIAYKEAQEAKLDTFTWEGRQFVTSYAKYMLVYLDDKLGATA